MKKIAFIIPPLLDKLWTFGRDFIYLGAANIAAGLLQDGHEVTVIDCAVEYRSIDRLKRRLLEVRPDIAAVPVIYGSLLNAYRIAEAVKETNGALVVFGGLPATFSAERIFAECPEVDLCALNEGELSMRALASGTPLARVPGFAYRRNGTIVRQPGPLVEDLDALPFPARRLFPLRKYRETSMYTFKSHLGTNLETKRGCPFSCEFCLQGPKEGPRYRLRSAESVVAELEQVRKDFPYIGKVMIVDNDFLSPYDHGMGIVEGILRKGLQKDLEFMVATRVQSFLKGGDALTALFARANIRLVYFGLESVNEKNRSRLKKIQPDYDVAELFERMRGAGVHSIGSYIFGFPNEDERDMRVTVDASLRDAPSIVKYNILTPYPGTRSCEEYAAKGMLRPEVPLWDYDNAHQVMGHPVDCEKVFRRAYRRFHLDPGLIRRIRWTGFLGGRKDFRLMTFAYHLLGREARGFVRDLYRRVKYGWLGSRDFVG